MAKNDKPAVCLMIAKIEIFDTPNGEIWSTDVNIVPSSEGRVMIMEEKEDG